METVEKTIEVKAPLAQAYNQWTQFESFPQFMDGVIEVRQLDAKRLHWKANIGGSIKEWDAEVVEMVPNALVRWRAISGLAHSGTVTFREQAANLTQVTVKIEYQPSSVLESLAGSLGIVGRRVEGDLIRFKEFIEHGSSPTGAWRERSGGSNVDERSEPRSKRFHT
jgi:uncharacterized membrane protein